MAYAYYFVSFCFRLVDCKLFDVVQDYTRHNGPKILFWKTVLHMADIEKLEMPSFPNLTSNSSTRYNISGSRPSHVQENFTHAPMYLFVLVTAFNILEFIIGTFGNTMVILVVCKVRAMRNPTNYFLLSLSVADLFVLLICQPTAMMEFYAMDRWYLGSFMCKFELIVYHTSQY